MDSELVVLHFASVEAAERALETIKTLDAEGFLRLGQSAILGRDAEGWVSVKPTDSGEPVRTSAMGGAVGLVVGGLIGIPVVGVLAGAGLAAQKASHAKQLEQLIDTVGARMERETGVLVLDIASLDDPEIVADRVDVHREALLRSEVPAELAEQLDRFGRADGSSGASSGAASPFEPSTGQLTLGDVRLAYLEVGAGPLAICLHGFPDTAWSWRHLMPALADAGYRVVAPFLRGYAPSTAPADRNGQAGAGVADICALHQELGGGSDAVLIGHDWGAVIAYGCATHAPDRWRRIVTASVPPGPVMAQAFMDYDQLRRSWYMFFFLNPLADLVVPQDDLAFLERLWADWSPGYDGSDDARRAREALRDPAALATALDIYRNALGDVAGDPRYAEHQAATGAVPPHPCLYLHGTGDRCIGVDFASPTATVLAPGSVVEEIDGAGHFLQLERPERVNRLILDFLDA